MHHFWSPNSPLLSPRRPRTSTRFLCVSALREDPTPHSCHPERCRSDSDGESKDPCITTADEAFFRGSSSRPVLRRANLKGAPFKQDFGLSGGGSSADGQSQKSATRFSLCLCGKKNDSAFLSVFALKNFLRHCTLRAMSRHISLPFCASSFLDNDCGEVIELRSTVREA